MMSDKADTLAQAQNGDEQLPDNAPHVLVVDDDQRLVGMVSDRDLLGRPGVLSDFMTPRVLTASPDTSLQRASEALAKQRFHSLVVVNDKRRPVGLLTSCDLLNFLVGHPAMRLWRQG